jgi:hypothetical protein
MQGFMITVPFCFLRDYRTILLCAINAGFSACGSFALAGQAYLSLAEKVPKARRGYPPDPLPYVEYLDDLGSLGKILPTLRTAVLRAGLPSRIGIGKKGLFEKIRSVYEGLGCYCLP